MLTLESRDSRAPPLHAESAVVQLGGQVLGGALIGRAVQTIDPEQIRPHLCAHVTLSLNY